MYNMDIDSNLTTAKYRRVVYPTRTVYHTSQPVVNKKTIKKDKMKTAAIICEFNPLHTGHKKLIDCAKTFSDKVICIMSGNFTQRGLPACAEKHRRAFHAIKAGADLVVELPTVFSVSSAENFALGGVAIANKLSADYLLFGSESGNLDELNYVLDKTDDKKVNEKIRAELAKGVTYPRAVAMAAESSILDFPNNTLALEYLRAIKKLNCTIKPVTVKREGNYHSLQASEYASSSALRVDNSLLAKFSFDYVIPDVGGNAEKRFKDYAAVAVSQISKDDWLCTEGVSEGIENRFMAADKSKGYDYLLEQVKTKRFTRARLQRIVLNALLKITKADVSVAKNSLNCIAAAPLAVSENSAELLKLTGKNTDEITKRADELYKAISGITPPTKLVKV